MDESTSEASRVEQRRALVKAYTPPVVLALFASAHVFIFTYLSLRYLHAFAAPGFDIGIFDQGVWLLSEFKDPFVTIRGLNLFADHSSFILLFIVPFYWLWESPEVLLITQTLALGMAAAPVYGIARNLLGSSWLALAVAVAFLVHPAISWTNLENFHPDSYEVLLLMTALYFMVTRRWGWFLAFTGLLLLVKEDVPLLTIPLGIYVALRLNRKVGIGVALGSAVWLMLVLAVLMPYFRAGGTVYWGRIPFGGPTGFVETFFTEPTQVISHLTAGERVLYVYQHLSTLAFLPLLSPFALVALGPLLLNLVSTHTYMHLIEYHYSTLIVPALIAAAVFGISRFRSSVNRALMVGVLLVAAVSSALTYGPALTIDDPGQLPPIETERNSAIRRAIELMPEDAAVSAHYAIVPHVAHREQIYEWPNPFRAQNWGDGSREGERLEVSEDIEYLLLLDPANRSNAHYDMYQELRPDFRLMFERSGVSLLERIDPGSPLGHIPDGAVSLNGRSRH